MNHAPNNNNYVYEKNVTPPSPHIFFRSSKRGVVFPSLECYSTTIRMSGLSNVGIAN